MPSSLSNNSAFKISARIMRALISHLTFPALILDRSALRHTIKVCVVVLVGALLTACSTSPQTSETMRLKLGSVMHEFRQDNPQWGNGVLELLPSPPGTLRLLLRGGRLKNLKTLSNFPITELIFDRIQFDDLQFITDTKIASLQIFSDEEINLDGINQHKTLQNLLIRFLTHKPRTLSPSHLVNLPLKKLSVQNAIIAETFPPMPELEMLALEYCSGIDDFSFLTYTQKLKTLELNVCIGLNLQTIPPLPVETVSLRFSPALHLNALNRFKKLKTLTISNPESLDFLNNSNIESLFVINADMPLNLDVLAGLNLVELELINCPLNSIAPLAQCKKLKILNLTLNQIKELAPLAGLKIQQLFLGGNPINSLAPLAECHQLQSLFVVQCPILSLEPLANLPKLQILKIEKTPISLLEPLIRLPLREIWLAECPINNLEPLTKISKLQTINLFNLPQLTPIPESLRSITTVRNHE